MAMQRHLRQIEWEVEPLSSHAQTAGARWAGGLLESVKSYAIPLSCYINLSVAGLNKETETDGTFQPFSQRRNSVFFSDGDLQSTDRYQ
jgi:hypothetical protein